VAIAIFKWCKAIVLCVLAFGLLKLLHRDVGEVAENFVRSVRVDPDNHLLARTLTTLSLIHDPQLATLSAVSFGYSALFLVEGTGLYLEKRWAEYLTIIATASLLPLELYELVKKVDVLKIIVLLINIAILVFLIFTVRNSGATAHK
jgi:uncharacterized membrane protein (DUF2068 family)